MAHLEGKHSSTVTGCKHCALSEQAFLLHNRIARSLNSVPASSSSSSFAVKSQAKGRA